ncbi:HHA-family regulatory protein [Escherichia coli]|nr:HHA-family regulatory protein [Escherichia coli]CAD6110814.1 HHA-family regulatory protein [Escherichia coli]CAD6180465.1 HHA-family regulatory protein [Escherichia coli]
MAKTKQEWLYQLRRCSSVNTLEKIIHKNRDSLSNSERESFNSAADHRLVGLWYFNSTISYPLSKSFHPFRKPKIPGVLQTDVIHLNF